LRLPAQSSQELQPSKRYSGRIGKLLATFQRGEDLNGPIQPDH
jgi:hypothetical protein